MNTPTRAKADTYPARGFIEHILHYDGNLEVAGWLCWPGHEFDEYEISLNGEVVDRVPGTLDTVIRDVIAPGMDLAPTRFFSAFPTEVEPLLKDWHTVKVVGFQQGKAVAHIENLHREGLAAKVPVPPEHLRVRVTRNDSPKFFRESAARSIGYFAAALQAHGLPLKRRAVLDWGCGCGRLSALAKIAFQTEDVFGSDIDSEAIHYCQQHIDPARFQIIPPHPPTSCSDAFFDTVLGYSVCTHLTKDVQLNWIKELNRVTKPGGIVMLSVHGPSAFRFATQKPNSDAILAKKGFISDHIDDILEDQAPKDYYRTTYQDPEWTKSNWGEYFEILGYHELGMINFHDLVVMRRPR